MRRWFPRSLRSLGQRWRASLGFRVVASTLVLCLVVIALLGTYLYKAIGNGLEADRLRTAQAESLQLTATAQSVFDGAKATSVDELYGVAKSLVETLAPPAPDTSRYVILIRSLSNRNPSLIGVPTSGGIRADVVPDDLREALASSPTRQQTKFIDFTLPTTNETVPAVVVGAQVQVSTLGAYDLYVLYPMTSETATLNRISQAFWVGAVILVALVAIVAWLLVRQVVSPVVRTSQVAERLAAGDLGERVSVRGRDELATLARSFNAMADSLQSQIRQLEALSAVQQRFVSDVSHELRTPLTTIRMASEVLHDSREDFAAPVGRSAELLHTEVDRFEELLGDLLEISRFDAGAAALDIEPTDLVDVVADVVSSSRGLAALRGSELRIVSEGPVVAEVDRRRVERILRNLVVNAIEHGEGDPVTAYLAANESAVAVVVEDHGVGLRPGEAALVFTRFWRADPARTRTTGGTGLGLAIALEDARLHDGWLQAWGAPGEGSRFRLTLPVRPGEPIATSPLSLSPLRTPSP
ncbi:MAG: MtrAB system histidine kinase MtrB [Nostocoides sp.]